MKFVFATIEMEQAMNEWMVDIHPYTVEFEGGSAGASGALFGVIGAYIAFFRRNRAQLPREVLRFPGMFVVAYGMICLAFGFSDEAKSAKAYAPTPTANAAPKP